MTEEVKYSKTVWAQAMNKSPHQGGLIITDGNLPEGNISLHCVNAKDGKQTTWLRLQIPRENLDDVINALKQFR